MPSKKGKEPAYRKIASPIGSIFVQGINNEVHEFQTRDCRTIESFLQSLCFNHDPMQCTANLRLLGFTDFPTRPIILHSDGQTEVKSDMLLSELGQIGHTADTALVLRQRSLTVSPNEYLNWSPPAIMFLSDDEKTKKLSLRTGTRAYPRDPKRVKNWSEFNDAAREFELCVPDVANLQAPQFYHGFAKCGCEDDVHTRVDTNVVSPTNFLLRHIQSSFVLDSPSAVKTPTGIPDIVLKKCGEEELLSFLELKTVWDVATPKGSQSLIDWWYDDVEYQLNHLTRSESLNRPDVYHVICQVYGYLSQYRLRYGMLCNGECLWFLHQPAPGELLISDPFLLTGKDPTIFRALLCLIKLVEEQSDGKKSPLSSPDQENPALDPLRHGIPTHQYSARSKNVIKEPKYPEDLDLDNLDVENAIGHGASGGVVAHTSKNGTKLAIKCCDVLNNPHGYEMIKNEVKVYQHLEAIQGELIPKLHWAGRIGELYFMAMELIPGESPDRVPVKIERSIIAQLEAMNVIHGDIRPANFIWDKKSNEYRIIDFGKSRIIEKSSSSKSSSSNSAGKKRRGGSK